MGSRSVSTKDQGMLAWVSLMHAATFLRSGLETAFRDELGFGVAEQDLLKQLAVNADQLTLTELAERVFFSKPGLTKMLDRLEADGLVVRETTPVDRRSLRACLTRKGRRALERSRQILESYVAEHFLAHLKDQDVRALETSLRGLLQGLGRWEGQQSHLRGRPHQETVRARGKHTSGNG